MSTPTVCVLWVRFGPYHVARLRAAAERFAREGVRLVGLEVASADAQYAWDRAEAEGVECVCAFPGRVFEEIAPREMEHTITAHLDRLDPVAVAFASYSTPEARAALAWCRRHRRAAVLMTDSRAADAERVPWREAIKRALVRSADAALVAGSESRAYVEALGVPPGAVFAPLDVVENAALAQAAGRRDDAPPSFLCVSRLTPVKNVGALLTAYAAYRQRAGAVAWPLVLVGDGPEREALERAAPEGVTFAGFVQAPELWDVYARAAAFVLPTHKDTWGLVVNEAMAAGLPVLVSTAAGCAADLVVQGENGFTFHPDDTAALADRLGAVARLTEPEREEMGARSREIIARYRPDDFAQALTEAVRAGQQRSARPASVAARASLLALRWLSRSPRSFHSIPD